jgi:hypothetical protein
VSSKLGTQIAGASVSMEGHGLIGLVVDSALDKSDGVPDGLFPVCAVVSDGKSDVIDVLAWLDRGRISVVEWAPLKAELASETSAQIAIYRVSESDVAARSGRLEQLFQWSRKPEIQCRLHAARAMATFAAEPRARMRLVEMMDDENIAVWMDATTTLLVHGGDLGLEAVLTELARREDDNQVDHLYDAVRDVALDVDTRLIVKAHDIAERMDSDSLRTCVGYLVRDLQNAPVELPEIGGGITQ